MSRGARKPLDKAASGEKRGTDPLFFTSEEWTAINRDMDAYLESPDEASVPFLAQKIIDLPASARAQLLQRMAGDGGERVLPLLAGLIRQGRSEELMVAVVKALGGIKTQSSAEQLAELDHPEYPKDVRKAARRGLFRLRSAGIDIVPPASSALPGERTPVPSRIQRAVVSHLDGDGNRLIYLLIRKPSGGLILVYMFLHLGEGIRACQVADGPRKELMEILGKELDQTKKEGLTLVDIPAAYAQYLIREARGLNKIKKTKLPEDFVSYRELIEEPSMPWERHLIYTELDEEAIKRAGSGSLIVLPGEASMGARPGEGGLLAQSAELSKVPEFDDWAFPVQEVKQYALEKEQSLHSGLVLSSAAKEERTRAIVFRVLEKILTPELRLTYKRRLEEMAYMLLHTGREKEAKIALAAALGLEETDLQVLSRHPFLQGMVFRAMEEARESVLVHPSSKLILP